MKKFAVTLTMLALLTFAAAQDDHEMHHRAVKDTAAWQSLKALVGQWDGTVNEGGKEQPSHVEMRMTGGGSALMHWMAKDTPYEMVTVFHPDLDELLATHYCAAHNQPRLKMTSATPKRLVFTFKDGTNIAPGDGHMVGLAVVIIDANHHDEEWTYDEGNGKTQTSVFHYTRKS
jgi:hypothetical protein